MTIRQSRYILAETEREKKVRVTEVQRAEEDPFIRKSEIQQTVNNSTLPVSSRAVNLVIEDKIASGDLTNKQYVDQKFNSIDLSSYASITYVDERFNSIDLSKYLTIENANQTYSTKAELAEKWNVQDTVGNPSGKVMREGAYGLGGTTTSSSVDLKVGTFGGGGSYTIMRSFRSPNLGFELRNFYSQDRFELRKFWQGGWNKAVEILHDSNTRTDKNNVLHSGTSNPIDTLNTSDMADTVVDNDLLTVTSGAVFRAIKQLTDQITSLEARVRELEDGGV